MKKKKIFNFWLFITICDITNKVCPSPAMTAALHSHDMVLRHLAESGAKLDKVRFVAQKSDNDLAINLTNEGNYPVTLIRSPSRPGGPHSCWLQWRAANSVQ